MLRELRIRDLAIIEQLEVEFGPGLNVLSGETGAGKSIILGALGLILGGRSSAELVRSGCESAEVQARFDREPEIDAALAALDLPTGDEDDGLLVRRIVTRGGRSRAYIDSTAVPISALRDVGQVLVDYASQHEHQVLLDEATHLRILDRYGSLAPQRDAASSAVQALRDALAERTRLADLEREQRAREEYLRYQLDELDDATLQPGELAELETERHRLRHAEELAGKAGDAAGSLSSASDQLLRAVQRLTDLVLIDPGLEETLAGLDSALIAAQEGSRELDSYAQDRRADPRRLEEVDERFFRLRELGRKHRCDPDGLPELRDRFRAEMDELETLSDRLSGLASQIVAARAAAREACAALSAARREAGARLSAEVESELESLAMDRARFEVQVEPPSPGATVGTGADGGAPFASLDGADRVVFQLSANPGEPPRPLARVASGGELSRILLAVRRALSGSSPVQVCIFDEVDSGLGGRTAETVGEKLAEIAAQVQVLCITHLPQIAARGDRHLHVSKEVEDGRTRATVLPLVGDARIGEIVRMVAGSDDTGSAEAFAKELLGRSQRPRPQA